MQGNPYHDSRNRRGAPSAPKNLTKRFAAPSGHRPTVGHRGLEHDLIKFPFLKMGDDVRSVSDYRRDFTFFG